MNALRLAHSAIRARFWIRVYALVLGLAAYGLLFSVSWRAALAVYLIRVADKTWSQHGS